MAKNEKNGQLGDLPRTYASLLRSKRAKRAAETREAKREAAEVRKLTAAWFAADAAQQQREVTK